MELTARYVLSDAAITLLAAKTRNRIAKGYDTLLLDDVNEVLAVAGREQIKEGAKNGKADK